MLNAKMPDETTAMTTFHSLINEIQDTTPSGSAKRQLRALTRITDLFAAGSGAYSEQQIGLFDEVFKTLVAVIELKTRVRLARHLATSPDAPATLVRAFAFDEAIAVAAPVLSRSMALSESDLAVSASTQSQGHLYAIARRPTISEAITAILIDRGEPRVVHAVAGNAGARISDGSFCELVARSVDDAQLALHVGTRRDIPRHHFLKLLETASVSVCSRIIAANPQFADAVQGAVTEVIDDINQEVRDRSPGHAKAKRKVKRIKYWRELREANVHAAHFIEEAKRVADRLKQRETRQAFAAAEQIIADARETAARDHARMLVELRQEVGRLVVQTTAAISGKILTSEDQQRLAAETARQLKE